MNPIIVVAHPETKSVITPSSSTEGWGSIRVEQSAFEVNNGIINQKKRVAFFRAKLEVLNALGLVDGQALPISGKIVVKESMAPFYEGQKPKQTPSGVVLKANGQPIYRETSFSANLDTCDELIPHTNVEEVKAAAKATSATVLA